MGYVFKNKKMIDGVLTEYGCYMMKIYDNGKPVRRSTNKYEYKDALKEMKKAEGTIANDAPLPETRQSFGKLLDDVIADYSANQRKTAEGTKQRIDASIRPALGHLKVKDITSATIRRFRDARLKDVSAGTVNRELNIISKAFTIADLPYRPKIEKLQENNVRTGFVTDKQFTSIEKNLPEYLRGFSRFLFTTAWRLTEGLNLMRKDVGEKFVTLEAGTTKNNEARRFPITPTLKRILDHQRAYVQSLERKYSRKIPYVFVAPDGERICSLRKAWKSACQKAGLGHILIHDLRRSAIMNFAEKGIDQQTGMLLSGHKTASVYRRYNIPTVAVLLNAAEKLEPTGIILGITDDSKKA